jgi:glycyl-tRNA synthetase beta chain
LADKLDTMAGFFIIDDRPTGSKDPFALRRAILSFIRLVEVNEIRASWKTLFSFAAEQFYQPYLAYQLTSMGMITEGLEVYRWPDRPEQDDEYGIVDWVISGFCNHAKFVNDAIEEALSNLPTFLIDRLKVQQREAGVRHDLIDAVFALGGEDDLVRLLARVKALQAFVGTDAGANLLAGYKRAGNILKSSPERGGGGEADGGVGRYQIEAVGGGEVPTPPPLRGSPPRSGEDLSEAETTLQSALDTAEPLATSAIAREDFEGAMSALSTLRAPIDAFFEGVMVNDPDPHKRAYRIGLLERFVSAVHRVADFSKIEG